MWKPRILIPLVLLFIAAGFTWQHFRSGDTLSALQYDTARVARGRVVAKVTATGTLSALVTVQVGSQVSGRIQEILVDFNSPVRKGQVLARIDPEFFRATLEQAQANVMASQGNLEKARAQATEAQRQYERSKALSQRNLISQSDLDTTKATWEAATAQVSVAKGNLAQSKAALNQARVNLGYTTIVSPINGIVISRNVDVGQTVAASLQAPTLFTIAEDLRRMQVDTNVAEADVGRLRSGMAADFTVDAYPGERFTGKVRQIRNAPQVVQNVVTYDAVIDVRNPGLKLKPGMTANVTFVQMEKEDVLRLPNAALRFRPPPEMLALLKAQSEAGGGTQGAAATGKRGARRGAGGGSRAGNRNGSVPAAEWRVVWVLRGDQPRPMRVRIGITDGSYTEIAQGALKEGDLVITDAYGGNDSSRVPARFRRVF